MRLLIAGIVLGVLAPTAAVLWFMNEAARSQEEAARRNVDEAYRGQLRLVRDRIDLLWRARAEGLDRASDAAAAIRGAGADGLVMLDGTGGVVYPAPARMPGQDVLSEKAEWISAQILEARRDQRSEAAARYRAIARSEKDAASAARAAQAEIRCLVSAGRNSEALIEIERYFGSGALAGAYDLAGRSIAADEQLLAAKLRKCEGAEALRSRLAAFPAAMPTAQRLFLIGELRKLLPQMPVLPFETHDRLALEFVEAGGRPGTVGAIEASGVKDVWKLTAPGGKAIALFRTETARRQARHEFTPTPLVRFDVAATSAAGGAESIGAGASMPGWQLSYLLDDAAIDSATRRHRALYVWVGYAAVGTLAVVGLVVGGTFTRHMVRVRLKSDLVAAVSHELKTPLASMRLLVDSLLEDGAADPQRTREYLELIAGENVRLTRLIENFLTFSRIERGRQRFDFAPVSPARLAESALAAMRERWPSCAVEVAVAGDLPLVRGDEDALVTVLVNLLENAYKYTGAEKRIALRAAGDGRGVRFAVEDNGTGIPAGEQKKIFRQFYQVDRRLSRETGGVGLGLSIVDSIVRAHGGTVEVESEAGKGSTFRVWLPVEAKA
jgi:signal transduction histidine kinase